ncbi:MAG: ribosome recycling factor [Patescibacteria group bacterium]|nr:ribosome recycling factor [Patescibacteria group bacterium]
MDIEDPRDSKPLLEKEIGVFRRELKNINIGRANPSLVEDLSVDYFGTKTPLKQVASISVSDARCLVITPWNKDNLIDIENAIKESDLNINPTSDSDVVRLVFSPLTEERRKEFVKLMKKKAEDVRIKVRKIREDIWDNIQLSEKEGKISEDEKFIKKNGLQEIIDEYNKKIEELSKKKEEEIMTV